MLDIYALYAPGLALLRVKLLKTCGLLTTVNLLLDLLLLQKESTNIGSYMQWRRRILINEGLFEF
jgi:hypothetical protein